ncbi:tetratricopeptide repeat protein [Dyadobacter arcticus]|uniref:Tetratricopeptide (TPR) repeat protein n=1 Tax=Dyadobacter arcticus TaxID=1078754 RepID=A0ABX0UQF7_9BACT|nr:tetratricopeptide repeat protein [Dyadobacter arcticus]NIJ53920.1 tetratricopeptide (TPR) repeat protein [Dyadobacter arcticus]
MDSSFLSTLVTFYEEDPDDPFNIYALAIAYAKINQGKAADFFDILLNKHPDYLATYYHAGAFFAEQEKIEKAERIYQRGIELARLQGNVKTQQELMRAYNAFLDELDD